MSNKRRNNRSVETGRRLRREDGEGVEVSSQKQVSDATATHCIIIIRLAGRDGG
jgi:hypothetical protein